MSWCKGSALGFKGSFNWDSGFFMAGRFMAITSLGFLGLARAYGRRAVLLVGMVVACVGFQEAFGQDSSVDTLRLSLKECVLMALDNDLSLKRGALGAKQASVDLTSAYMNLLPNLNGGLNTGLSSGRSIDPTTNDFITQLNRTLGVNLNSNWVLFSGLSRIHNVKRARTDLQASKLDVEVQRNTTIFSVVTLYLNVLLNKELLANARSQLASTQEQKVRTQKLVEAGSLAAVDLLNLQSQEATDQVSVVQASNNLRSSLLNLKQLLLVSFDRALDVDDEQLEELTTGISRNLDKSVAQIYQKALETRPEIRSADLRVTSASLQLKISQGGFSPTLSLNAGLNSTYSSVADRPRPTLGALEMRERPIGYLRSNPNEVVVASLPQRPVVSTTEGFGVASQLEENLRSFVSLSLSVPIFQRWRTVSSVQNSRINYHRALIGSQEIRNSLRNAIELAYNDARAALQLYAAADVRLVAVEETYRAVEERYNLGTANYTELQVQRNTLFQARSQLLRQRYSFAFRKRILDFYQGSLVY